MNTPIIIPIIPSSHSFRDCIVQAGTRYCESSPVNKNDIGAIGLGLLIMVCWIGLWIHLITEDKVNDFLGFAILFGVPCLFAIIYSLT